ncbi:GNVR domain-containing protein [Pontibacter sp. G13]|uniref:GumC family protein n=1 Tax=Pontibacter sp. G13 TaxID=3074898 RepID=UPI00288A4DDA|nr:GNVR domain-containing protein [Pontibacter sp. G13]WNJ19319.1 GNVR domain-containing protein [Pontibacter sp. G13]
MRFFRPFIKGWWVLALAAIIGGSLGYLNLYYAVPMYLAHAKLQINDKNTGASDFLKGFEAFSQTGQVLAEVEVMRSKYLVKKTVEKLNLRLSKFRFVRSNPRLLYPGAPFEVEYKLSDSTWRDVLFHFNLLPGGTLTWAYEKEGVEYHQAAELGAWVRESGIEFRVLPNATFLAENPGSFDQGEFGFKINSIQKLLGQYANHNLAVDLPDKEVPIVKLKFKHEVPQMAQDVVNTLAETYIEDFIYSKTQTAGKALEFINGQVDLAEEQLQAAEEKLAEFKSKHQVVDLAMETDAQLKRLTELEMRKLNLSLQQTELRNLLGYLQSDIERKTLTPNYETLQDPTFTDAISKINTLRSTLRELRVDFTDEHPDVLKTQQELERTRNNLVRSVQNTLSTNQAKFDDMDSQLKSAESEFTNLPDVERQLLVLRRQFLTLEQVYGFLLQKRTEASIGAAATIAFHKLLEPAELPRTPVSPQKGLIMGMSVMVGMIVGLGIVFFYNYLRASVFHPSDIEDHLDSPVISTINHIPQAKSMISQDFINLAINIQLLDEPKVITVFSHGRREGAEKVTLNLAKSFAVIGLKTLVIDADLYVPELHRYFHRENVRGLGQVVKETAKWEQVVAETDQENLFFLPSGEPMTDIPTLVILHRNMRRLIETFREKFDRIIINLPAIEDVRDSIAVMQYCDFNLFVVRADITLFADIAETESLMQRFKIEDLHVLLIQREKASAQATYSLNEDALPPVGGGARRKMLKAVLFHLTRVKPHESTRGRSFRRAGFGDRRKMLNNYVKRIWNQR